MRTSKGIREYIAVFLIVVLIGVWVRVLVLQLEPKIGNTFSTINGCIDLPCPLATATFMAQQMGSDGLAKQFQEIDKSLSQSIKSSIAYNAPQEMKLNETDTIELLLNPSVEPSTLATQLTEGGQVIKATIQVTPRMKAVLLPVPEGAFLIQPLHDNAEQLISTTESTKWSWDVTAKEGGTNTLTLVIYRLVTIDGSDNWRIVETYRSDIDVEITAAQRLLLVLDWKWLGGIIVTAILIPAFWRWVDQRKKQNEQTVMPKRQKKKAR